MSSPRSSKERYSPEAWARRLAYGREYRKKLRDTTEGKKKIAAYHRKWYLKNRDTILKKEFERRQKAGAHIRGHYKNTKWKRKSV